MNTPKYSPNTFNRNVSPLRSNTANSTAAKGKYYSAE